jgi:hypothetical protein
MLDGITGCGPWSEASVAERLVCSRLVSAESHVPESKRTEVLPLSLELKDDAVARTFAQTIANKTGKTITVTDDDGNEVAKAKPSANALKI